MPKPLIFVFFLNGICVANGHTYCPEGCARRLITWHVGTCTDRGYAYFYRLILLCIMHFLSVFLKNVISLRSLDFNFQSIERKMDLKWIECR